MQNQNYAEMRIDKSNMKINRKYHVDWYVGCYSMQGLAYPQIEFCSSPPQRSGL